MARLPYLYLLLVLTVPSAALAQDDPCAGQDVDACVEGAGALVLDDATVPRAIAI